VRVQERERLRDHLAGLRNVITRVEPVLAFRLTSENGRSRASAIAVKRSIASFTPAMQSGRHAAQ
jgi:hypothetical protein